MGIYSMCVSNPNKTGMLVGSVVYDTVTRHVNNDAVSCLALHMAQSSGVSAYICTYARWQVACFMCHSAYLTSHYVHNYLSSRPLEVCSMYQGVLDELVEVS